MTPETERWPVNGPCISLFSSSNLTPEQRAFIERKRREAAISDFPRRTIQAIPLSPIAMPRMTQPKPKPQAKPRKRSQQTRMEGVTVEAIRQLEAEGLKRFEIAERLGCSRALISKRLPSRARSKDTDALIPRVVRMRAAGVIFRDIATAVGVHPSTAMNIYKRRNERPNV